MTKIKQTLSMAIAAALRVGVVLPAEAAPPRSTDDLHSRLRAPAGEDSALGAVIAASTASKIC